MLGCIVSAADCCILHKTRDCAKMNFDTVSNTMWNSYYFTSSKSTSVKSPAPLLSLPGCAPAFMSGPGCAPC